METILNTQPGELDKAIFAWMQELAPEGICITDDQLRIRVWNWWLESKSGLSKEQVIGRKLVEVFPDLEARRVLTYFQKALEGEVSVLSVAFHQYLFAFPAPIRDAGFSNMLQTARVAPLALGGKLVGTISTIQDVTEREYQNGILRKQHEKQELFSWALAHLLQSTHPELMVKEIFPRISAYIEVDLYFNYLLEPDGKLHLNSSEGLPVEIQKQYGVIDVSDETLNGICALKRETVVTGNISQCESASTKVARQLGLRAHVCHPLLMGTKLIGTLSFMSRNRDQFGSDAIEFTRTMAQYLAIAIERSRTLIALHDAQAKLGEYAGSLENKVNQRTAELEHSLKALETFSYTLAHDVRAPLRHVRGFAEALLEDCGDELSSKGREYVDLILRAIQRLDALTKDIMAYGQLSQESSPKTVVDLEALLREIISTDPGLLTPGTVTIQSPLLNPWAERFLLEQCLTNLLENALKFVPKGVTPRIKIFTELKDQCVRISVEDNGIGVPPEFHHKIFGVFERLPTQQSYDGTGIGLAIVAKATQQMDGTFGVESLSSGGSRFWLELPTG